MPLSSEPVIITFPTIMKASVQNGRRIVECEISNEIPDIEHDVIEQKALLDAAPEFIKTGHVDIEHLSELAERLHLPDPPESFIIGRPTAVYDLGEKRTGMRWEVMQSSDGIINALKNRYDAFWQSLQTTPPTLWRASVFGYPTEDGLIDCRKEFCNSGARRFHIKGISLRSVAMTRNPVNDSIKGFAKIVTAKSYLARMLETAKTGPVGSYPWAVYMTETQPPQPLRIPGTASTGTSALHDHSRPNGMGAVPPMGTITAPDIAQSQSGAPGLPASTGEHSQWFPTSFPQDSGTIAQAASVPRMFAPRDLSEAVGQWHTHGKSECEHCMAAFPTTLGLRRHFESCCGMPSSVADIFAHAVMHKLLLERNRKAA